MTFNFTQLITTSLVALSLISCASTRDSIVGRPVEQVDPTAVFDLTDYMFHKKLTSDSGTTDYTESYYRKDEPSSVAASYEYTYQRNGETIDVRSVGLEGLAYQYTISADSIHDARPTLGDSRSFPRYARMGDTFLDAEFTSASVKESCVLSDFFETYNLSSATGSFTLSNKSYNNVIRVRCISEFTNRETDRENYRWSVYYAKGIGPVFKAGNWQNYLGHIYSIYDH